MSLVLEVRDLSVVYPGGGQALNSVSLSVPEGQLVAVVGANGVGKTTLLRAIAGFLRSERVKVTGSAKMMGNEFAGRDPSKAAKRGLYLIPERYKVFRSLTVGENLKIAATRNRGGGIDQHATLAAFPFLADRQTQKAGLLSGGEQQLLALAGAFISEPRLLLVDEPSLGLSPIALKAVLDSILRLRREFGTTVVLVDQNSRSAMSVADEVHLMEAGRIRRLSTQEIEDGAANYLTQRTAP